MRALKHCSTRPSRCGRSGSRTRRGSRRPQPGRGARLPRPQQRPVPRCRGLLRVRLGRLATGTTSADRLLATGGSAGGSSVVGPGGRRLGVRLHQLDLAPPRRPVAAQSMLEERGYRVRPQARLAAAYDDPPRVFVLEDSTGSLRAAASGSATASRGVSAAIRDTWCRPHGGST